MKNKVQRIKEQIENAKRLQWNASQMRDARGVFAARRELENLWKQLDQARLCGAVE
jgi:hypothetical protein